MLYFIRTKYSIIGMNYVLMTILIGFLNVVCFSVIAISHHHILIVHRSGGNLQTAVMAGSSNLHLPPPVSLRLQRFLIPFALYLNHLLAERIKDGMSVFSPLSADSCVASVLFSSVCGCRQDLLTHSLAIMFLYGRTNATCSHFVTT